MTLDEVRVNIDRVDKQIKELFQERMELADQVAQIKAQTGDQIFKPDREEAIIQKLTADIVPGIKREYIALIKRIMEVSRKYQYGRTLELRDCLDVEWKETNERALQVAMVKSELYICDMVSKDSVITVEAFEEIGELSAEGKADAGIGIMEDVSIGVSDELHQTLVKKKLFINTCKVIEDNGVRKKVVMFGKDLIVDAKDNRMKVMFVCRNRSGSLASILSMVSDYDVNLTEIHSRPNGKAEWNYEFYLEFEGNLQKKEIQALIFQLRNETQYFQILGSYFCEGDFS